MSRIKFSLRLLRRNANIPDRNFAIRFTPKNSFSSHPHTRLENAGPLVSQLKSRSVIHFRGPDTVKFLQGLLTNDLRRLEKNPVFAKDEEEKKETTMTLSLSASAYNMPMSSFQPIYAAMLNAQGRFLYDFFLYRPSRPDEKFDESGSGPSPNSREMELFADVDGSVVDELSQTLKKYKLRSKVDIENVDGEYCCWQHYGGKLSAESSSSEEPEAAGIGWGGNVDQTAVSSAHGNGQGWQWYKDPRLDCLGFRGLFPSNIMPPLVEADKEVAEENYLLWRIEKGVAEGSAEIPKGEAIPLEYNLAGLNAISFDKGCYVGQELVARTQHRGVIRKRVLPLKFVNDQGEEIEQRVAPGSVVTNCASGKKAGNVTTVLGSRGLGLLRLEDAFHNELGLLVIEGSEDVKVEVFQPDWWPAEWLHDH